MKLTQTIKQFSRYDTDIRFQISPHTYIVEDRRTTPARSDLYIKQTQISLNTHQPLTNYPLTIHALEELLKDAEIIESIGEQYAGLTIARKRIHKFRNWLNAKDHQPTNMHQLAIKSMDESFHILDHTYQLLHQQAEDTLKDYLREHKEYSGHAAAVEFITKMYVQRLGTAQDHH